MKTISGTVQYFNLETGFWGIIGKHGKKWRPVNMPEQLKTEGKLVEFIAEEIKEEFSFIQWGTPIKILSLTT